MGTKLIYTANDGSKVYGEEKCVDCPNHEIRVYSDPNMKGPVVVRIDCKGDSYLCERIEKIEKYLEERG